MILCERSVVPAVAVALVAACGGEGRGTPVQPERSCQQDPTVNDAESWIPGTFPGYGRPLLFGDALEKKDTYAAVHGALAAP